VRSSIGEARALNIPEIFDSWWHLRWLIRPFLKHVLESGLAVRAPGERDLVELLDELAALPEDDWLRRQPALEALEMPHGRMLYRVWKLR